MSLTTASKRRKRGLHNYPAPLDMTLLGVPGSPNPRGTILVSAARPSIKESVAALGLNYSLSSGGIPDFPAVPKVSTLSPPLPEVPDSLFSRSPPNLILITSSCSPHCTTTDTSAASSKTSLSTTPPNLARLQALSLPTSPILQKSGDTAAPPPPPTSNPASPVTPPLLSPAPARPTRRWGMIVFPQNKAIRRVSSAPSSPAFVYNPPFSPTSIIAIKSPVEWTDSRRISDAFSLMSPLMASLPQVIDVPPLTLAQTPSALSMTPMIPPKTTPLPPVPTPEDSASGSGVEKTLGKGHSGTVKESDSPVKAEEKQPRSPIVRANPKPSFRGRNSNSYHKRMSTHRRESSVRGPNRRVMLKRDSGAPFATAMAAASESSSPSTQAEWVETKEGRRNTKRWSASRKFLQASTRRAKATVVMMRRGKEKAEEKDIVAVIPQLRELKAPKRLRL